MRTHSRRDKVAPSLNRQISEEGPQWSNLFLIEPVDSAHGESGPASAPTEQIDDYHHQSHDQQQVNQTSSHVQAKAQQPENQKYSHNRPKHNRSPLYYPSLTAFLSRETVVSDFPHSRQTRLARGVISPQNGHILCERTSSACGLNNVSNVLRNFRTEARRRPREGR